MLVKNEFSIEAPEFGETTNKIKDEDTLKLQIPNVSTCVLAT